MIVFRHIQAIIDRHLILQFRDLYRLIDLLFWPTLDVMLWGFTVSWLSDEQSSHGLKIILFGLILWQAFYRSCLELSTNMLQELWDRNFAHLFCTPLTLTEWVIANILLSIARTVIIMLVYAVLSLLLYDVNFFNYTFIFMPHIVSLILSGWSIGLFSCALLIYSGHKAQALVLPIAWVFMPFVGVFYPVDVVPTWMNVLAKSFPMTYVFDAMRAYIINGDYKLLDLLISFSLNTIYLTTSIIILAVLFQQSKKYGFARLE